MLKLELVTHCYRYASLLRYQLSSLVLHPPSNLEVLVTVFYAAEDAETCRVLEWFGATAVPNVTWSWRSLPVNSLCRRGLGRNIAALGTLADWVWFTDADHWFEDECWRAIAGMDAADSPIVYPRVVHVHKTHELGDACIARSRVAGGLVIADPSEFAPERLRRAIGGVQIAKGDWCRERGYLRNSKKVQCPVESGIWLRTHEDVWFRKDWGTAGRAVDIPGVYRIRHSQAGRFQPGLVL